MKMTFGRWRKVGQVLDTETDDGDDFKFHYIHTSYLSLP